jgi:dihydroflavonol-4-reductase
MNVLVTGANGFLGHHVVFELLKQKHSVSIIVRNTENINFDLDSVQVFKGNFDDYTTLKQAVSGCEAIIHIAAVTSTNLLKYEDYKKINVEGSTQVIKVAKELSIKTIVYISSANTIGFGNELQFTNERFIIEYPFTKSFYAKSKMAAEQLFVKAAKELNWHVVIINPTFMIGSFDSKPSSGKLILIGYKKSWMFIPRGGKNFVAVEHVAIATCNALTMGKKGERYLASGIGLSFKEFYTIQSQICGYNQKIIVLPDLILKVVGKVGDFMRMFGIKTELCSMNIRQLLIREFYNNKKAKEELKLPETDIRFAIKNAVDWFKEHNMV